MGRSGHMDDLADFCSRFHEVKLDENVVASAKRHLTDLLAVAVAGSGAESSRLAFEHVAEQAGREEATAIGPRAAKVPAANAAFCNGVSAHALELDDVHLASSLHPGVVVVPAAIAACERAGASGEDLLKSVTIGYEVMTRMGIAVDPKAHYAHGFHPTSTCGVFGAAAAAAHAFGLNREQLVNALGIAASTASGLLEFSYSGSYVKRFHTGWAAHAGLTAALLAGRGFSGPPTAVEGECGFLRSYSHVTHPEALSGGLGDDYAVCNTQVKFYACCTYQHAALTGMKDLMTSRGFGADDVVRVDVGVVEPAMRLTYEPRESKIAPQSIVDAQFSLPYGIAVMMLLGGASIDQYTGSLLQDPRVLDAAAKVYVRYAPSLDQYYPRYFPAQVTVSLLSGETVSGIFTAPKGHPENRLTEEEMRSRFVTLTRGVLGDDGAAALHRALSQVESQNDVRSLSPLFSAARPVSTLEGIRPDSR